ncbi:unnamed protein product [Didymodactylos carnosus]|uniref:Reverse transcriptase domain-containing protein n=1 Tax=Didymodactylos carnosus TaxID=1234261 RepID=A0A8S2DUD1_9BILA|nr:unnamed protein product [Didymodactylos carnosus]CAF3741640.1 unnamed protein product [Didymodactylos carnosus]
MNASVINATTTLPQAQRQQQITPSQYVQPISFQQLTRAMSSNLPCFLIEFDPSVDRKEISSDITAANLLEQYFSSMNYDITFSLVGHTGNVEEETRVLLRVMFREVKMAIAKYKTEKWQNFLSTIQQAHDRSDKAFWNYLSRIYKPKTLPFSKLAVNGKSISYEQEISEELFNYYNDQFKEPQLDSSDAHDVQIEREYNELKKILDASNETVRMTNTLEITKYIKKLKGKESSGYDDVSNYMLKFLPPAYVSCLTKCFSVWLSECRYPEPWKIARIVTLNKLKAGVPRCDQTRPISLLSTHSKLSEKVLLERVRLWAESQQLIPPEQSDFCPGRLLPTRVLSIYQEVKNNFAGNIPTLAIYFDYQKAYDKVWHIGFLVKLYRLGMPFGLLKIIASWLLPQGSFLSPYLFIVYHTDLVSCLGAHSSHSFADDLNVLIRSPIYKDIKVMISYLEEEGTRLFYSQVIAPVVKIFMEGQEIEMVKIFKYLGFTWASKLSLKPTVDKCLENIQKSYTKLKWMKGGKAVSLAVLRKCFFAFSFPHFA